MLLLALLISTVRAEDLRVGLVGDLKLSAQKASVVSYPTLQKALEARPQVLGISPAVALGAQELASLPVPTFVMDTPQAHKIKNPNLVLAKDVAQDLELALKVCDPSLFKSAMHLRACLTPHREKLYPQRPTP